jgi:hypothetical protein
VTRSIRSNPIVVEDCSGPCLDQPSAAEGRKRDPATQPLQILPKGAAIQAPLVAVLAKTGQIQDIAAKPTPDPAGDDQLLLQDILEAGTTLASSPGLRRPK